MLREYRRKAISANSQLKLAYPDAALFHIFCKSLPNTYKPLTRAFIAQPSLSVEEKIDMLTEHEMEMRHEEKTDDRAYAAKSKVKISKRRHQNLDSDSESESQMKCYLCKESHPFQSCKHVKLAGKLLRRHLREKKKQLQPDKKPISFARGSKTKKSHGYKAVSSSSGAYSENSDTSDTESDEVEVCHLSQIDINT